MTRVAWVVGSSGLLGRAMTKALRSDASVDEVLAEPMDWSNRERFNEQVAAALRVVCSTAGQDWSIYWCAGAATVGTNQTALDKELDQFVGFLDTLETHIAASPSEARGLLFFASSAGAVFAGSVDPPFTEDTIPVPIAPYGHAKLAAERRVRRFSERTDVPVLIGRITNLYGADQNLDKAQGIISQLCRSFISRSPTSIYVSLDTIRDYITADDCASLVLSATARLANMPDRPSPIVLKIMASHQAVTLGAILGTFRSAFKRRPDMMIGSSPKASLQVRDLRVHSVVWPDLDERPMTPLAVGVHAVAGSMMLSYDRTGRS